MFFRLCPAEESQIQDQTRAWIYPKFQSFTSGIQKDDSRQGIAFENIDFWPPALAFTVLPDGTCCEDLAQILTRKLRKMWNTDL